MIHFLILAFVLGGGAMYFMTPDERTWLLGVVLQALRDARDAVTLQGLECDEFFEALRARNRRVIVAPSVIALSAIVFVFTAFGSHGSNGDWWHLLATPFTYIGVIDLLVGAVCLLQISLILERLAGPLAFTTVYIAAGLACGIVNLSVPPDGITVGAAGPVFAMYGLLLVTSTWSLIHRSSLTIPLSVAKRLAPVAAVFVLYNLATIGLWHAAGFSALVCGVVGGVVMTRDVNERTPPIRRVATAVAAVVVLVTMTAYTVAALSRPQAHVADVGPAIERIIAVEAHTAGVYDHAVERFRKGRITTAALAEVIQQTIVPDLHAAAARLHELHDVPPEHQPLVATADEFLKLRDESWRLRAAALLKSDSQALRQADRKEQASLEAFHRVKTPQRSGGD